MRVMKKKSSKAVHLLQFICIKHCVPVEVNVLPAGIWCENDVVLTSMRRDDVASTLIRCHFRTKCLLGCLDFTVCASVFCPVDCAKMYCDLSGAAQIISVTLVICLLRKNGNKI